MSRTCLDCPTQISATSQGRCRPCARKVAYRSPESLERLADLARARWSPEYHAMMIAARMAWCPVEYRELNRELTRKHIRLAERKVIIADQAEHDRRRAA